MIIPSFDEPSARVIQTNELSTTTTVIEGTEQTNNPPSQIPNTNNEYVNPRGIRFTTSTTTTTPTAPGPTKGKEKLFDLSI